MKILLTSDGQYFLVDTANLTAKSLKDVLLEAADAELVTVALDTLTPVDLGTLLEEALRARTEPQPAIVRASSPRGASTPAPRSSGTPRATPRSSGLGDGRSKEENDAVRAWGIANGYAVKELGRIKNEVYEAYDKAHSK